jgi:hypothetical protein
MILDSLSVCLKSGTEPVDLLCNWVGEDNLFLISKTLFAIISTEIVRNATANRIDSSIGNDCVKSVEYAHISANITKLPILTF